MAWWARVDTDLASSLYNRLAAAGISYAREHRVAPGVQQIRDPGWILADKWATCLDLATAYASMCLEAHVRPLLVVTESHAWVALALARMRAPQARTRVLPLKGFTEPTPGVLESSGDALAAAIDAGQLLGVETVFATTRQPFADAVRGARTLAAERGARPVRLVDVLHLHANRIVLPLERPRLPRPSVRLHVPPARSAFVSFEAHRDIEAKLRSASSTVVLLAPQGRGKSTLARKLAEEADDGAGWFLTASDPQALIASFAEAERAERNEYAIGLAAADRQGFAHAALARLREAQGRWIVVLDNADGDPGRLLRWLPQPNQGAGQLVIVTTTNPQWGRIPDVTTIELPPLSLADVEHALGGRELDELVDGRPLLVDAFERFLRASGWQRAALAACAPDEGPPEERASRGPAALWAAARSALGQDVLRVAGLIAHLPPDHQPLALLEALQPGATGAVDLLAAHGLVNVDERSQLVRIHRLFARAIADEMVRSEPDLVDRIALELPELSRRARHTRCLRRRRDNLTPARGRPPPR